MRPAALRERGISLGVKAYFGCEPGCGSAIGKDCAALDAAVALVAAGDGAGAPAVPATGGGAVPAAAPVLAVTAARKRCALLSVVVTCPARISLAVKAGLL
jgi:hypothetical protein